MLKNWVGQCHDIVSRRLVYKMKSSTSRRLSHSNRSVWSDEKWRGRNGRQRRCCTLGGVIKAKMNAQMVVAVRLFVVVVLY